MGTEIEQQIAVSPDYNSDEIFQKSYNLLRNLESNLSFFLKNSSIGRLNRYSGKEIQVDSDTIKVLDFAKKVPVPLYKIEKALRLVDGTKLQVFADKKTAKLSKVSLLTLEA